MLYCVLLLLWFPGNWQCSIVGEAEVTGIGIVYGLYCGIIESVIIDPLPIIVLIYYCLFPLFLFIIVGGTALIL